MFLEDVSFLNMFRETNKQEFIVVINPRVDDASKNFNDKGCLLESILTIVHLFLDLSTCIRLSLNFKIY